MDTSSAELRQAIALAKSGNRSAAQEILVGIVRREPKNEIAWLWLADTMLSDSQRLPVLREALRRNPDSLLIQEAWQSVTADTEEEDISFNLQEGEQIDTGDSLVGEADPDEPDLQQKLLSTDTPTGESRSRAALRDVFWVLILIVLIGFLVFTWIGKRIRPGSVPIGTPPPEMTITTELKEITPSIVVTPTILLPTQTSTLMPLPVGEGTLMPDSIARIESNTANGLEEIARWGQGSLHWAAWSPDGSEVAVVFSRGIDFYSVASGEKSDTWLLDTPPSRIQYSPDGSLLAGFSGNAGAYLMQRNGYWETFPLTGYAHAISDLAFSPDGSLLAGAGSDGTVLIWDVANKSLLKSFGGGNLESITSVAFSSGGGLLASGSEDGSVIVWYVEDGSQLAILAGHRGQVNALAFSPSGLVLASASMDSTIRMWDIYKGKELFSLDEHDSPVSSVAFSADGTILLSAGNDSSIRFWGVGIGIQLDSIPIDQGRILQAAYSQDGNSLLISSVNGTVMILSRQDEDTDFQAIQLAKYSPEVRCSSVDLSRNLLATGTFDGRVRLLSILDGHEVRSLAAFQRPVTAVAFSADGSLFAAGDEAGSIRIWDPSGGGELMTISKHRSAIYSLVFTADNQALISSSLDGTIRVFDLINGHELTVICEPHILANKVLLSSDEQYLVAAMGDNTIRIWSVEDGKQLSLLQGHSDEVIDLALTPNGDTLISSSLDGTICIWSMELFTLKQILSSGYNEIESIALSADGSLLSVGFTDGMIQLWDLNSGRVSHTLKSGNETLVDVFFTVDDQRLVSIVRDGFVTVWGIVQETTIAEASLIEENSEVPTEAVSVSPGKLLPLPIYFIAPSDGIDQVWRMEVDGKTLTCITSESDAVTAMDVSPADGSLAYVSGNNLIVSTSDGSDRRVLVEGELVSPASQETGWLKEISSPVWSPTGTRLAYGLNGVMIYEFYAERSVSYIENQLPDLKEGKELRLYRPVLWSPHESRLFASVESANSTSLVILQTDGEPVIIPKGISACCQMSWHNDGYEVWLGSSGENNMPGGLWRIDATDGTVYPIIEGKKEQEDIQIFAAYPIQSMDGKIYSFFSQDVSGEDAFFSMVVTNEDGQSDRTLVRSDSYQHVREILWAPDASLAVMQLDDARMMLLESQDSSAIPLSAQGYNLRWGYKFETTGVNVSEDEFVSTEPSSQEDQETVEEVIKQLEGVEIPLLPDGVSIIGRPKIASEGEYGLSVARYQDKLMIWLESYLYTDQSGTVHSLIDDVLTIPYDSGMYFWHYDGCQRNGKELENVMVMGPANVEQEQVVFAWVINLETMSFDATVNIGISCQQ